ncbi:MAG: hypothetical protein MJ252_15660 [archaeon]|nr:hypothetical protein [archaeon]
MRNDKIEIDDLITLQAALKKRKALEKTSNNNIINRVLNNKYSLRKSRDN